MSLLQLISRHDAMIYLRLVSASQVGSDSDLRSLVTSMQSEITRLKALLDAKPPAATTSAEPEQEEEEEQEDDEDDDEENDDEQESQEEEEHETPPPKGTKPAEVSVAKGSKPANKGPNSTSHRAEWMKFGRRMESQGSEFPEMSKMWNGTKEETWLLFGVPIVGMLSNITEYMYVHPNQGTARSVCKVAGEGDEHGQHRGPADH